jgi:hypothetical protein
MMSVNQRLVFTAYPRETRTVDIRVSIEIWAT